MVMCQIGQCELASHWQVNYWPLLMDLTNTAQTVILVWHANQMALRVACLAN